MSYRLIADEQDFIIIEKFSGIEFHSESGIVSILRDDYEEIHGVHRLDRETSGLMIFAKNKEAQSILSQSFERRDVLKLYIALSKTKPTKKMGIVIGDLVKSRGGSYKLSRTRENPSKTQFFSAYCTQNKMRLFILKPFTGRTHQLRVVLKSLGSPILGDKRYGGEDSNRMHLHSYRLSFKYKEKEYDYCSYPSLESDFSLSEVKSIFKEELNPFELNWK